MPLVINSLGGGHTHTNTHINTHTDVHTGTILRNQASTGLSPGLTNYLRLGITK